MLLDEEPDEELDEEPDEELDEEPDEELDEELDEERDFFLFLLHAGGIVGSFFD